MALFFDHNDIKHNEGKKQALCVGALKEAKRLDEASKKSQKPRGRFVYEISDKSTGEVIFATYFTHEFEARMREFMDMYSKEAFNKRFTVKRPNRCGHQNRFIVWLKKILP